MADTLTGVLPGSWTTDAPLVDVLLSGSTDVAPVFGNAASSFGWSTAASATERFTATAASAFGWSTSAVATERFSAGIGFSFGWSTVSALAETFSTSTASSFTFSTAAQVAEAAVASVASAFGYGTAAAESETFAAATAASFVWQSAGTLVAEVVASFTAASAFSWSDPNEITVTNPAAVHDGPWMSVTHDLWPRIDKLRAEERKRRKQQIHHARVLLGIEDEDA